jgi:uncharacterized protein YndB with AHSA1/START domain
MIKQEHTITINKPIETVMQLFENQDNFKHWQAGLVDFENITSTVGKTGSKRKMKIRAAGTTISMIEKITREELPHLWEATYRTKGVVNEQSNRFRESVTTTNQGNIKQTVWEAQVTFKFTGMMRLVAKANPKMFSGQTYQFMKDFKRFAEEGISVLDR